MKKNLNPNIAFDTLNMMNLFDYNTNPIKETTKRGLNKDICILHIPHSSDYIPSLSGFINEELMRKEIELVTDHYTDQIFDVKKVNNIVTPFSRVFCDVEKFDDENEPMVNVGHGFFYTHNDNGDILRIEQDGNKDFIYHEYYLDHQRKVESMVDTKLNYYDKAMIIDCHSFPDIPFKSDLDQSINRPDICIGIDEYHTPKNVVEFLVNYFNDNGFSVKINSPYVGTYVSLKHYQKNPNVHSVMIEINRKLYLKENNEIIVNSIKYLNELINNLFN